MKSEIRNPKSEPSTKKSNSKVYDLEQRTFEFAKNTRDFVERNGKGLVNSEYAKQLVRSSGSVGANYIEANESLSKKDLIMRIKISKKEAKESIWWLKLLVLSETQETERELLIREATEIMSIFGAILMKLEGKK